jgi:hypothetical protein
MRKLFLPFLFVPQFFIATAQVTEIPKNYTNVHISPYIDNLILSFIPEINPDSIRSDIQTLQDFGTRYALAPNRKAVALWIKEKYLSFGITDVILDSFPLVYNSITYMQYNVIATIPGTVNPEKVYIIGGHSDAISINPMINAPGADDNASGISAAIEIARVMKKKNYQPETTIKFIAFAAEEGSGSGSLKIAKDAIINKTDVGLVINNDMISYLPDTATTLRLRLNKYNGAEWACDLSKSISLIYTSLIPFEYNIINYNGVDSYSFWVNGIQTCSLEEATMSPHWHQINDSITYCNMIYCAEIIKVSLGLLLYVNESPSLVKNYTLSDMGNGSSVIARWNRNKDNDLSGYRVYIGTSSNNFATFYSTTDTAYIISGLTAGIRYYVGVSAFDNKGNESVSLEKNVVPEVVPLTPAGLKIAPFFKKIKPSWNKNTEYDLLGYNIYRSTTSGQNFVKINTSIVGDTSNIDSLVSENVFYFYKVTAVDSLLHESPPSNEIKEKAAFFSKGILLVDDSEGGLLNPTDEQVDNFYNYLLSGYNFTNYDAYKLKTISMDTMGNYSSILWHIENTVGSLVFYTKINEVKKYLDAGGKMILTFDRPSRVINHSNNYPLYLSSGKTMFDYMKIKKVELSTSARFIGARPYASGYDSVYIDINKTPPEYNHHISNIEAIYADSTVATNIYAYDSHYDISTPQGLMKNKPVGVEYMGNDYKIVTLSFPLYYMDSVQAKRLVYVILQDKFHQYFGIKEKPSKKGLDFSIYPNPAKSQATISYYLSENSLVILKLYNITGVLIKTITNKTDLKGFHQEQFDVSELTEGVYLLKIQTSKGVETKKLLIQ